MPSDTLETERLILRRFTMDDVDALFLLNTVPELIRYTGNKPFRSREQAAEFMQKGPLYDYQHHGYGRLACVLKTTQQVIGFTGIKFIDELEENELGYRLLPAYWQMGLAKEAARAVLTQAKSELNLSRIISLIHPENNASKNVVRKLGFQFEKSVPFSLVKEFDVEVFAKRL